MTATGAVGQPATGDQAIDALLALGKWNATTIDYNFPTSSAYYGGSYGGANNEPAGFVAVSESFKTMVRSALAQFEAVTNLDFTEVAAGAASNISIARTSQLGSSNGQVFNGYGYYPGSVARAGDVWFSSSTNDVGDTYPFSLGRGTFTLVLHELGHALGLKHPHEASGGNTTLMPAAYDYGDFTVMSYKRYENGPTSGHASEAFGRPQTLMMYDILALQTMYGANYNHNATDTVYVWSPTTGQMFVNGVGGDIPGGGNAGANRIYMTVWDGGGNDTYDFSNYTTSLNINLDPGSGSTLSTTQLATVSTSLNLKATANVFNALLFNGDERSIIENAIGGSGHDHITGNWVANELTGGVGNDTLDGGDGIDTAKFNVSSTNATWERAGTSWTVVSADGTDTLISIERLAFLDRTVVLSEPKDDFNGDGTSDILFENAGLGAVSMYAMDNGVPTWVGIGPSGGGWSIVSTGDLNGDGTTDILFESGALGAVSMYQMDNGVPTWVGIGPSGGDWHIGGTGDFNGDGTDDILFTSPTAVAMYEMHDGSPTWTGIGPSGGGWSVAGIGDFNGDGTDDILFENSELSAVAMYEMHDGVPTWTGIGASGGGWKIVGTGDFNGDGTDDILFENSSIGALGMYAMDDGVPTWAGIGLSGGGWDVIGTGDYNGDGTDDILFENTALNAVGMYEMHDGVPTWVGIGPTGGGWEIV